MIPFIKQHFNFYAPDSFAVFMTTLIIYVYKTHMKTLVHSNKTATSERMLTHCESTRTLWSEEDGKVSVYFFMHANTAGYGSGRDF